MQKEQSPEELFFNSAPKKNRDSPFSFEQADEQIVKKNKVSSFFKTIINNTRRSSLLTNDVSFFNNEKTHTKENLIDDDILNYYTGLYIDKSPDPFLFKELLLAKGSPDYANPYPENSLEYFSLHPMGFLAADLEMVIEGWLDEQEKQDGKNEIISVKEKNVEELKSISVVESENQIVLLEVNERKNQYKLARICWAMLMSYGNGLERLKSWVHEENLSVALLASINESDIKEWGMNRQQVIDGAKKQGIYMPISFK